MSRKPRSDAKLKNLAREIQSSIIARMSATVAKPGEEASTSIEAVLSWISAECGITTSAGALSQFWSWHHLRERMEARERQSLDLQDVLRKRNTGLDEEQIISIGNQHFLEQGVASGDAKLFASILDRVLAKRDGEVKARQKERQLDHMERRITMLEKKAASADKIEAATRGKPSAEMTVDERAAVLRVVDESFGIKPKA